MIQGGFSERTWRRGWRWAAILLPVLFLLATNIMPGPRPAMEGPGAATLTYTPVQLAADDPGRRDVGRLHFLGGWELASPDRRFGGLSGLRILGNEAIAVSDAGMVITFPLPGTSAAPHLRFFPVIDGPGRGRARRTRDTEGIWIDGTHLWLTFERQNAVWRYDRATLRGETGAQPAPMRGWRGNSGAEAIARLADGHFLVLEEGQDNGTTASTAVLFGGDPALPATPWMRLTYQRPANYRATDAAPLPDGRVLILNRALIGLRLSAKLVVADVRGLRPGGILAGQEVATLEAPLVVDNMEGVAVTQENGRTIVWLVSDDDFMRVFRRTLLLKFELRLP
jgi:hypothetical protein